jgi:hypothetical protein
VIDTSSITLQRKTKHFKKHIDFTIVKSQCDELKLMVIFPKTKDKKEEIFELDGGSLTGSELITVHHRRWTGCHIRYQEIKSIFIFLDFILHLHTLPYHKFLDLFE